MVRLLSIQLFALLLSSQSTAQNGTWTPRADAPVDPWWAAAFAIDGIGYLGTGAVDTGLTNRFWAYDPTADAWDTIPSLPAPGSQGTFHFAIDGAGYVGGVGSEDAFWQYVPATRTWTARTPPPVPPIAVETIVGFSCGGKGYFWTRSLGKALFEYDPATDIWTEKASYPGNLVRVPLAAATDSLGFVGIGFGRDEVADTSGNTPEWYCYDPRIDTWTRKADFPGMPRNSSRAFTIDSTIYVGHGIIPGPIITPEFWAYHVGSDTWTRVADYPEGIGSPVGFAFAIDGKGYVGTANFGQFYAFDPLVDTATRPPAPHPTPLSVFPNPVADFLRLAAPDTEGRPYQLYDSAGRAVATGRVTGQRIDVAGLPAGVYALAVETAAGARVARIVRE